VTAPAEERLRLTTRLRWLQGIVVAVFVLLGGAFWYLQVVQHARFREMAENNHLRTMPMRAPRGVIVDRRGEVLVENRRALMIAIVREQSRDLDRTVTQLAQVLGFDEAEVRAVVQRHRREPTYRPIVVVPDATLAQVAAVSARRLDHEMPDVVVQEVPTREYPQATLASHLLGYVGEASLEQTGQDGFASGSVVGQSGLERLYNRQLMGVDGLRRVVVNSVGREIRTLEAKPPSEGQRVRVSIDASMQRAADEAFTASGYAGAAVVLDVRTGDVLTMTSRPGFDPNAFASGIDRATWTALNTDGLRPLQNRAIQGRYSPGSTFKIAVAAAALEEGVVTPDEKIFCPGGATFFGRFFKCNAASGHGWMDMAHALEKSCNVYFYTVGNKLGIDRIYEWSDRLGLAGRSGIDLPNEVPSLVPSPEWKRQRTGERWYAGETISVSIGQGQVSVTPMSMALMMASIARGGERMAPRLVTDVFDGTSWSPVPRPAVPDTPAHRLRPETVATIHEGLWLAVNGSGTARSARISGRDVAGKTGTAQVISNEGKLRAGVTRPDLRDHGWFVFMAPLQNPEVAGVVFAEHAEHGSSAAPIARHLLETYFAGRDGTPLPRLTVPPPAEPQIPPGPRAVPAPTRRGGTAAAVVGDGGLW
jgi:penicillin-binding protein 2